MAASSELRSGVAAEAVVAAPSRSGRDSALGLLGPAVSLQWCYAALVLAVGLARGHLPGALTPLVDWIAVPADCIALVALCVVITRIPLTGLRRSGWSLLAAGIVVDLFMTVLWTRIEPTASPWLRSVADVLYQIYYPVTAGACGCFFLSLGGSFRRPSTWLDLLTIMFGVAATLWAVLYQPIPATPSDHGLSLFIKVTYSFNISMTLSMSALLFTQIASWRTQRSMMLVAIATLVGTLTDIAWLAQAAGNPYLAVTDQIGPYALASGDVAYAALITSALWIEARSAGPQSARQESAIGSSSLIPVLAVMLSITLFVAAEANSRGISSRVLIAMLLLGSILLVARQRYLRGEIRRLNSALALREAEARLTELVRCSADVLAVVDASLATSFISPAAASVLGVQPDALQGQPAAELLGEAHVPAMRGFLERVMHSNVEIPHLELTISTPSRESRTIRIIGRNQLGNSLIQGITLTLVDVTEQRALEREVVEIATRERHRLSSDIHEGLGQELAGIAMLLSSAVGRAKNEPGLLVPFLESVSAYMTSAIGSARQLATGLSPLCTVRGSMASGLERLAAETSERLPVRIKCEFDFAEDALDDSSADYLYRIVQEAISNALRHGEAKSIVVALTAGQGRLALVVTDDGRGPRPLPSQTVGLGRRMIAYRVRLMGGEMEFAPVIGGGARLVVVIPLSEQAAV